MDERLNVSSNPHVRSKASTQNIMLTVVIALLPAFGFGVFNFGINYLIPVIEPLCVSQVRSLELRL